jgi:hypothetical protein
MRIGVHRKKKKKKLCPWACQILWMLICGCIWLIVTGCTQDKCFVGFYFLPGLTPPPKKKKKNRKTLSLFLEGKKNKNNKNARALELLKKKGKSLHIPLKLPPNCQCPPQTIDCVNVTTSSEPSLS